MKVALWVPHSELEANLRLPRSVAKPSTGIWLQSDADLDIRGGYWFHLRSSAQHAAAQHSISNSRQVEPGLNPSRIVVRQQPVLS